MKISQDVRDYSKDQRERVQENASALSAPHSEGQQTVAGGNYKPTSKEEAEAIEKGMQDMAEKFKESGGEIYQKVG
jgi:hypothetical protein